MTRKEYDELVRDIDTRGMTDPICVSRYLSIGDGWMRYFAAMQLELVIVPVCICTVLGLRQEGVILLEDLMRHNYRYRGVRKLPKGLLHNDDGCWVTLPKAYQPI